MLHVSEADIKRLLPLSTAIDLVREAYVKLASGQATNPPRVRLQVPGGASMFFMPGYVQGQRGVTVKAARVNADHPKNSLPTVLLTIYVYDAVSGLQVAEVEADWLTAVRTAASTAVATDFLAKKNVKVLGIFGSGQEATTHILTLKLVRDFEKVLVYSRDNTRREAFAARTSRDTGIRVEAADSSVQVAKESDVMVTATTSSVPVFDGRLVRKGSHVNAIGGATPDGREVDSALVRRSKVVVDSRAQAVTTYGDIVIPIREKAIRELEITELGDLLIGQVKMPTSERDLTLFKAGGLAVLDAMVTNFILDLTA